MDGELAEAGDGRIGMTFVDPSSPLGGQQQVPQLIPEQVRDPCLFVHQPAECQIGKRRLLVRQQPGSCNRGIRDERHQWVCPS